MHQAVNGSQRHRWFHEHIAPLRERRVGGDGQTLSLLAFRYQFKQHGRLGLVTPHVTEVIENQQVKPVQLGQLLRQA
jgi:hypothetical protein